jgi:hypothetical protein
MVNEVLSQCCLFLRVAGTQKDIILKAKAEWPRARASNRKPREKATHCSNNIRLSCQDFSLGILRCALYTCGHTWHVSWLSPGSLRQATSGSGRLSYSEAPCQLEARAKDALAGASLQHWEQGHSSAARMLAWACWDLLPVGLRSPVGSCVLGRLWAGAGGLSCLRPPSLLPLLRARVLRLFVLSVSSARAWKHLSSGWGRQPWLRETLAGGRNRACTNKGELLRRARSLTIASWPLSMALTFAQCYACHWWLCQRKRRNDSHWRHFWQFFLAGVDCLLSLAVSLVLAGWWLGFLASAGWLVAWVAEKGHDSSHWQQQGLAPMRANTRCSKCNNNSLQKCSARSATVASWSHSAAFALSPFFAQARQPRLHNRCAGSKREHVVLTR